MTEQLACWESIRLSKHFILLDFMADRAVYRSCTRLAFNEIWGDKQRDALARSLCNRLLEPLIEAYGPISVADAFWPSVFERGHADPKRYGPKHRWAGSEATVDIAPYRLVDRYKMEDEKKRGNSLKNAVKGLTTIDSCCDRIISYRKSEFLCVTFKESGANKRASYDDKKKQNLRAHHVRVGRYFNLLDFCRSGRAVELGCDLVPKGAEKDDWRDYSRVPEEAPARSFAAALDPLVERVGRISVVRGMETAGLAASDEHACLHRWDRDGPWRLVFVLPQGTEPDVARVLLASQPHVRDRDVQLFRHASDSYAVALIVNRMDYDNYRGLRLCDPSSCSKASPLAAGTGDAETVARDRR